MSDFLFGLLDPVTSLLFTDGDTLNLGTVVSNSNISLTQSGLITTLGINGLSLNFDTLALTTASQEGHVSFADGTHLIVGDSSADVLHGTSTNDAMYGMDGNDWMAGSDGHDYLMGGQGSDTIDGGAGNDHIYGAGPSGGTDGADSLSGGDGDDYIQGNAGADAIDGGTGNDRILGGQDNDTILGGDGNDNINGNLGNDQIDGGAGDDVIRGGKGDDVVTGGSGNDTIMGDLGADTMSGGAGADLFQFRGNDAASLSTDTLSGHVDTISDFTIGQDHISLAFVPAAIHDGSATTVAGAVTWATLALTGHGSDVAEVSVGADSYLFYSSANGLIADSVIKLAGVHDLPLTSFV